MNKLRTFLAMGVLSLLTSSLSAALDPTTTAAAAKAVNAFGLDLFAKASKPDANALLSPYSIQAALAMTYAGAEGVTRTEMTKVLHYPGEEEQLHRSFSALQSALAEIEKSTAAIAARSKTRGGPSEPITLTVANRLFGQQDFAFRAAFLALVKDHYDAPFQPMDFVNDFSRARVRINDWVEDQTRRRICDLIPADGLDRDTRLVLVNAIYLKAPWQDPFSESATRPLPFHVHGRDPQKVPTMFHQGSLGYARRDGFSVVTVPYSGGELQFLILLPNTTNGLPALEASLTPAVLADCAQAGETRVNLYLPKFKMEPPVIELAEALESLGMKSAFDHPQGSANFDRMAPRKPDDYLFISKVFHKAFLALDEEGTEAAAATAVVMTRAAGMPVKQPEPIEVRVDHPFLFAIQHRPSGACLFLGRMSDPR